MPEWITTRDWIMSLNTRHVVCIGVVLREGERGVFKYTLEARMTDGSRWQLEEGTHDEMTAVLRRLVGDVS